MLKVGDVIVSRFMDDSYRVIDINDNKITLNTLSSDSEVYDLVGKIKIIPKSAMDCYLTTVEMRKKKLEQLMINMEEAV